jgi:GDP-mannose 6-dehydrogenase
MGLTMTKIAVYGMGYVGTVTAVSIAKNRQNVVVGVEPKKDKRIALNKGVLPFYEPGMQEAWEQNNILVYPDVISDADVSIICVGTPTDEETNKLDISTVIHVAESIVRKASAGHLIIVRSTMSPGGMWAVNTAVQGALPDNYYTCVIFMPEFLREGCALGDVQAQDIYPFGLSADMMERTEEQLSELKHRLSAIFCIPTPTIELATYKEVEILKLANNVWHAQKITFANEISRICYAQGADSRRVMSMLCKDKQKNISSMYMRPGFAWGGSCLPKDVRQLKSNLDACYYPNSVINALHPSNREHINFCRRRITDTIHQCREAPYKVDKLIVLGIAFKADTDDLRESAVLIMLDEFCNSGNHLKPVDVYTYDPHVELPADCMYDTNIQTLRDAGFIQNAVIAVTQWNDAYWSVLNRCKAESCIVLDMFNTPPINNGLKVVGISW